MNPWKECVGCMADRIVFLIMLSHALITLIRLTIIIVVAMTTAWHAGSVLAPKISLIYMANK